MATSSSRQSSLFGLQDWKKFYQTYATADFQSFDYESLRKNFIDYLSQAYPETFNDYVESSEFVALLDVMAFMGQSMAFRSDLNARENFLDTAERRDSVIKLANLVSYSPKRNIAGQGLLKITAITSTEDIKDVYGNNLSNATLLWNDPANKLWQEQFNTVLNATLVSSQRVGRPGNSQTILNIKTDEYAINILPGVTPTIPFQTDVDNISMNFEAVSVTSLNKSYLYEVSPAPAGTFNVLYRNDKLGYGSLNTGFFVYFKQGSLQTKDFSFAEKIKNNLQYIDTTGINDTDTWLYKLDDFGNINQEWTQVESVYAGQSATQNGATRTIFGVTSGTNDTVTYTFSDGVFGDIPTGPFRAYFRTSNSLQYTIDPAEMSGINVSTTYVSRSGRQETLTMTLSLQTQCSTAQARESLSDIKERAPARYYTQNRMVNGEDYTNFPFTLYNSIIKSKALNRSSIGITRNLDLLDPTSKYSSTNVVATDGSIFFSGKPLTTSFSTANSNYASEFLQSTLPSILSSAESVQFYQTNYARKGGTSSGSPDGKTYWTQRTATASQVTGYFSMSTGTPVPVGTYSAYLLKYCTPGAHIKFITPDGTPLWVYVLSVIGDGFNFGQGFLDDGSGPITLDKRVPTGSYIDSASSLTDPLIGGIIPTFANTLPSSVISTAMTLINLNQDFYLIYYPDATGSKWVVSNTPDSTNEVPWYVKFEHSVADTKYVVYCKGVVYSFASVGEVRFVYDSNNTVYDPRTGKLVNDLVTVYKTNGGAASGSVLAKDISLNITGQPTLSDGFADDFRITVSSVDSSTGISTDPDFFTNLVGKTNRSSLDTRFVFFQTVTNTDGQQSQQLLADDTVIRKLTLDGSNGAYADRYAYVPGTVFFCTSALTLSVFRNSFTVTATSTNTVHHLKTGDSVTITDFSVPEYNGTFVVTVISDNQFSYMISDATAPIPLNQGKVSERFYKTSTVLGVSPTQIVLSDVTSEYIAEVGRGSLSFLYRHNSGNTTRVDPATTNIIDLYLVTQSHYTEFINWLSDITDSLPKPAKPTINELRQSYGKLDEYKMMSDSVIPNSVTFKPLFGRKADKNLQGTIKVVKAYGTTASDSQIRSAVLSAMNSYFSINNWNFGDSFYFSELTAFLHSQLGALVSSVIMVPADPTAKFGDLYEIKSAPDEIFCNGATTSDIVIISGLNASNMNR
jgi:hypothetical protein